MQRWQHSLYPLATLVVRAVVAPVLELDGLIVKCQFGPQRIVNQKILTDYTVLDQGHAAIVSLELMQCFEGFLGMVLGIVWGVFGGLRDLGCE